MTKLYAYMTVAGNGHIRCDENGVLSHTPALMRGVAEQLRDGVPALVGHRTFKYLCADGILGRNVPHGQRTVVFSTSEELRATARVLQGHEGTAFADSPFEALEKARKLAAVFDKKEILLLGGLRMFHELRDEIDAFSVYEESGTVAASPLRVEDYWDRGLDEVSKGGRVIEFNKNDGTGMKSRLYQFAM